MSSAFVRRTSNPHGHRRLLSCFTDRLSPCVPVRVHPHPYLGLALEEFCEELLDLRRCRELLQTLESRPGVDPEERRGVLRIEIDDVREVAGLLSGVFRGALNLAASLTREFVAEHLRRPALEAGVDDLPRRVEREDELV